MYIYVYIILFGSFVNKNWHSGNIKPHMKSKYIFEPSMLTYLPPEQRYIQDSVKWICLSKVGSCAG